MVDVIELKQIINELKKLKNSYYNTCLNYYHIFDDISGWWKTNKGVSFYNIISRENNYYLKIINNIDDLIKIFVYVIDKYESIGNKIVFNVQLEEKYIDLKDAFIECLRDIVSLYDEVNLIRYDNDLNNLIGIQKNNLIKYINNIDDICNKNKEIIKNLNYVEKEVKVKLSKINVEVINITDIEDYDLYVGKSKDVYVMDAEKMKNVYNKGNIYVNIYEEVLNNFNDLFMNMSNFYKTDNLNVIEKLECEIIIGMRNIKKMQELNLEILSKEIVNVLELEEATMKEINNINTFNNNDFDIIGGVSNG